MFVNHVVCHQRWSLVGIFVVEVRVLIDGVVLILLEGRDVGSLLVLGLELICKVHYFKFKM